MIITKIMMLLMSNKFIDQDGSNLEEKVDM